MARHAVPALPTQPLTTACQEVSVRVDQGVVTVLLDGCESSALDLDDPTWLDFEYLQHFDVIVRSRFDQRLRALHLGAGACSLARAWDAHFPQAQQVCVDIDGELLELVRAWFSLPRAPRLKLRAEDARTVVAGLHRPRFDVVVRDVFLRAQTPPELTSATAVQQVRTALLPGGMYLANIGVRPGEAVAELSVWLDSFAHVIAISDAKVWRGARRGNIVIAGSDQPFAEAAIATQLRRLPLPAQLFSAATIAAKCGRGGAAKR